MISEVFSCHNGCIIYENQFQEENSKPDYPLLIEKKNNDHRRQKKKKKLKEGGH